MVLVIGSTGCDDVPIRLFRTEKEARYYCAGLTEDDVRRALADVFGRGCSVVLAISMVTFRDGVPVKSDVAIDFLKQRW